MMAAMIQAHDLTSIKPDEMAALEAHMPSTWPETLREFGRVFFTGLRCCAQAPGTVQTHARIAVEQVHVLAHQLGGQQPYIPSGKATKSEAIAAAVRRDFNGRNHAEVAHKNGVTVSHVRGILREKKGG